MISPRVCSATRDLGIAAYLRESTAQLRHSHVPELHPGAPSASGSSAADSETRRHPETDRRTMGQHGGRQSCPVRLSPTEASGAFSASGVSRSTSNVAGGVDGETNVTEQ